MKTLSIISISLLCCTPVLAFHVGKVVMGRESRPRLVSVPFFTREYATGASSRPAALAMFGGLFGGDDGKKDGDFLAKYEKVATGDLKYQSLSDYIDKWSKLFETDPKGMQLTTPVRVLPSKSIADDDDEDTVVATSGVQLVFQRADTGYKSRKEEDQSRENQDEPGQKKKKETKQGGVEVVVQQLSNDEVRVIARRCEVDEDTMIKEMSEDAILQELKKAVDVWKREAS